MNNGSVTGGVSAHSSSTLSPFTFFNCVGRVPDDVVYIYICEYIGAGVLVRACVCESVRYIYRKRTSSFIYLVKIQLFKEGNIIQAI